MTAWPMLDLYSSFYRSPADWRALLHIYAKLGVGDRAAAVAGAFNRGLLSARRW